MSTRTKGQLFSLLSFPIILLGALVSGFLLFEEQIIWMTVFFGAYGFLIHRGFVKTFQLQDRAAIEDIFAGRQRA